MPDSVAWVSNGLFWTVNILIFVMCEREESAEGSVITYLNIWWPDLQKTRGAKAASLGRAKALALPRHESDLC